MVKYMYVGKYRLIIWYQYIYVGRYRLIIYYQYIYVGSYRLMMTSRIISNNFGRKSKFICKMISYIDHIVIFVQLQMRLQRFID